MWIDDLIVSKNLREMVEKMEKEKNTQPLSERLDELLDRGKDKQNANRNNVEK